MAKDVEVVYSFVGGWLQNVREIRGISRAELAKQLEFSPPTLANIESGRYRVQIHTFLQLCRALDVDPGRVFSEACAADQDMGLY